MGFPDWLLSQDDLGRRPDADWSLSQDGGPGQDDNIQSTGVVDREFVGKIRKFTTPEKSG